jgi:hypothetical protein
MFKKKATVNIGPYKVTIDAEDQARVVGKQWTPIEGEFVMFVTDAGTPGKPAYRTLGQMILGVDSFVALKDRSYAGQLNYSKRNLKAS